MDLWYDTDGFPITFSRETIANAKKFWVRWNKDTRRYRGIPKGRPSNA
jgi:hypothetical protein